MLHHKLRAAGGVLQSIEKISHVTASSSTITVMSDVQAGDLLIFSDFATTDDFFYYENVPTQVTPSGFTIIKSQPGYASCWSIFYKIANGTESGTVLTGMNDAFERKRLILFRGNRPIRLITTKYFVEQYNRQGPISGTITSSSGITPFIIMGFYGTCLSSSTPNHGYTFTGETADETIGYTTNSEIVSAIKYKIKNRGDTSADVVVGFTNTVYEDALGINGFCLELE